MSEAFTGRTFAQSHMAKKVREYAWEDTALGPIASWSSALRIAASATLASRFPSCLLWGDDLIAIYNDAFKPILGCKPEALGVAFREIWAEAWNEIGPIAESALAGDSTFIENFPLTIERNGFVEQAYFTFCYSPVCN